MKNPITHFGLILSGHGFGIVTKHDFQVLHGSVETLFRYDENAANAVTNTLRYMTISKAIIKSVDF